MNDRKNIALVAHDNRKKDMIEWVDQRPRFMKVAVFSTKSYDRQSLERYNAQFGPT
jgi:methylglyoxal synthase